MYLLVNSNVEDVVLPWKLPQKGRIKLFNMENAFVLHSSIHDKILWKIPCLWWENGICFVQQNDNFKCWHQFLATPIKLSLSLSISVLHFNLQFFSEIRVTMLTMDSIHFIDVHKHMYMVDILVIMVLKYNDSTWSEIELCETTRKLSIFYRIANSIFNQCLHEHFTKCMLSTTKHVYRVS